jgi:hypothetical protein
MKGRDEDQEFHQRLCGQGGLLSFEGKEANQVLGPADGIGSGQALVE